MRLHADESLTRALPLGKRQVEMEATAIVILGVRLLKADSRPRTINSHAWVCFWRKSECRGFLRVNSDPDFRRLMPLHIRAGERAARNLRIFWP